MVIQGVEGPSKVLLVEGSGCEAEQTPWKLRPSTAASVVSLGFCARMHLPKWSQGTVQVAASLPCERADLCPGSWLFPGTAPTVESGGWDSRWESFLVSCSLWLSHKERTWHSVLQRTAARTSFTMWLAQLWKWTWLVFNDLNFWTTWV